MRIIVISILLSLGSVVTYAATLTVSKDGAGQYSEIQDAVNAAESGDTILIGAGRYDEYRTYNLYGDVYNIVVNVDAKDILIVGSGENTIIGPDSAPPNMPEDRNYRAIRCANSSPQCRLSNLRVENSYIGILATRTSVSIDGVTLYHCWDGLVVSSSTSVAVTNSVISNCLDIGIFSGSSSATIMDCIFNDNSWATSIDWYSYDVMIGRCTFTDNANIAVQYSTYSTGTISDCNIHGSNAGIIVAISAQLELYDTTVIPEQYRSLYIYNDSQILGHGNVIKGNVEYPAISILGASITMSESHIISGGGGAVRLYGTDYGPEYVLNLRNNYWGTSNAEEIAAVIWDAADNPEIGRYIEFVPYHDQAVSNDAMSFGEIKAMFRR